MNAKDFDQFYTQDSVAETCLEMTLDFLKKSDIENPFFFEPSAGDGAFLRALKKENKKYFACDIEPRSEEILQADFLQTDLIHQLKISAKKNKIIVIGNPPFGKKGKSASAFINRAFLYSDTVAFVLPIQFNKYSGHNQIIKEAKLILNEPLPHESFVFMGKPYAVRCCFQIWTTAGTPLKDLRIKNSPITKHEDFEMWQYNCTEEALKFFDKERYKWDFAVARQGFKDYSVKETDPEKLDRRIQWIFFRAKNKEILERLKKIDFVKLSLKNSTIPGFGKADVVEYYTKLYQETNT